MRAQTLGGADPPLLSVIVPTRERRELVTASLRVLLDQADRSVELLVVDDGSTDGTPAELTRLFSASGLAARVLAGPGGGPAAARNVGIKAATGHACLFIDDDVHARPGLVERHLRFHSEHPQAEAALLGRVVPAPAQASELAEWAHSEGPLFSYGELEAGAPVPANRMWTAQVSIKTGLLREAGGFDESMRFFEDVELAHRLQALGMQLRFEPEAVGDHLAPVSLEGLMKRAAQAAPFFPALAERVPGTPLPARPAVKHRMKASALQALWRLGIRPAAVRHAAWRFLIDEAQREALWGEPRTGLAIGAGLERSVLRG